MKSQYLSAMGDLPLSLGKDDMMEYEDIGWGMTDIAPHTTQHTVEYWSYQKEQFNIIQNKIQFYFQDDENKDKNEDKNEIENEIKVKEEKERNVSIDKLILSAVRTLHRSAEKLSKLPDDDYLEMSRERGGTRTESGIDSVRYFYF